MIYKIIFLKPKWTASDAMDFISLANEKFIGYEDNAYFHTFTINNTHVDTRDLEVLAYDENTFILCE
jgi:hypothetical protein